jgi:hypothetical protein
MMYWLADGDPVRLMQLGKMGMVDYFWMLNKKIAEQKRLADQAKKQKRYG